MALPPELQDLLDNARETLHVELKEWLNLTGDDVTRAKMARHIAALANSAGGYVLLGFSDDGVAVAPPSNELTRCNADIITSIVDRYLTPAFQCEVFFGAPSTGGISHPIIRVPSHGSVPICSKKDGPHDSKSKPQGIRRGEYYIRVPGPKSRAIETPEEWRDLIHRCVVNEREQLLASMSKLLMQPQQTTAPQGGGLKDWHDKMRSLYLGKLTNA